MKHNLPRVIDILCKKKYNTITMIEEIYNLDEDLNPRLVAPEEQEEEVDIEVTLRPQKFERICWSTPYQRSFKYFNGSGKEKNRTY